jgi:hypothetical protein
MSTGIKGEDAYYSDIIMEIQPQIDALLAIINDTEVKKGLSPSEYAGMRLQVHTGVAALKMKAKRMAHEMFISSLGALTGI